MSASKNAVAHGQPQADGVAAESLSLMAQNGLARAMEVPKNVMEASLDTGAELLTFVTRRMKAQAGLFSDVGQCHDINEAAAMQRIFWARVTEDYSEEMSHLIEIARQNFVSVSSLMIPNAHGDATQKSAP